MLTRNLTRRITQALTRKATEPGSGGSAFVPLSATGGTITVEIRNASTLVVLDSATITLEAERF